MELGFATLSVPRHGPDNIEREEEADPDVTGLEEEGDLALNGGRA